MKLTASIKRLQAGTPLVREIYLDGKRMEDGHSLSRALTNTTNEGGNGIFNAEDTLYREQLKVKTEFGQALNFHNYYDAQAFLDEVIRRADYVTAAFADKYPVHESVGAVERNTESTIDTALPTSQRCN